MGKMGISEVDEINAVEETEGEIASEDNYIKGVRANARLQSRPRWPDSNIRSRETLI